MIPTTWEDPRVKATGNATLSGTILKNGETGNATLSGTTLKNGDTLYLAIQHRALGLVATPSRNPFTVHVAIDAGLGGVRVEMRVRGPVPRSGMHRHACE